MVAGPSRRRLAATLAVSALVALAGCGVAGAGDSQATAPFTIAMSNYYSGNNWRKAMISSFVTEAEKAKAGGQIQKYTVADSNDSVPQQIAQIQSMILQGYRAIAIDAASPTALNGVIAKACEAHIIVVVFDSLATAGCAYKVTTNYVRYGELETRFVADHLGGKGNLLIVRGIAGSSVDNDIYQGMLNALAEYPGLTVVGQVNGNFTESVTQQAVAGILPSLPKIDAILGEGNDTGGAMEAFQQSSRRPLPLVIMGNTGQDLREWQQASAAQPGYQTISLSSFPSMSSVALWIAYLVASGKTVPRLTYVPMLTIPTENRDAWANAISYAGAANNVLTLRDTEQFIDAQKSGQPVYVASPRPSTTGS